MINMVKLPTNKSSLFLRVAKGHFATSHSHINYYIDVTTQKARLSEAKAVAKELVAAYQHSTIVDTVLCLDGTQVIGTCLANELTKDGFANMNAHQTIYVITPEYTSGSQIILRDNLAPMVRGKHVLILSASITTGYTVQAAIEAVNYYGGTVAGLSAIFATTHECLGIPVTSIFDPSIFDPSRPPRRTRLFSAASRPFPSARASSSTPPPSALSAGCAGSGCSFSSRAASGHRQHAIPARWASGSTMATPSAISAPPTTTGRWSP